MAPARRDELRHSIPPGLLITAVDASSACWSATTDLLCIRCMRYTASLSSRDG